MSRDRGLFITGTDTGVGKTYVGCLIARSLRGQGARVGVYKPVASGCRLEQGQLVSDDAVALWNAARRESDSQPTADEISRVCPQCFAAPLAPHLAARAENKSVDRELLRRGLDYWREQSDVLIVEGVGGLLTPISDEDYVADLAREFGCPLIVVSRNVLGTINQTLQTLYVAATYRDELPVVAGVVLNDAEPRQAAGDASTLSNAAELRRRCRVPLLEHVPWNAAGMAGTIDWLALAAGACG